jgi:hypothetical protein
MPLYVMSWRHLIPFVNNVALENLLILIKHCEVKRQGTYALTRLILFVTYEWA